MMRMRFAASRPRVAAFMAGTAGAAALNAWSTTSLAEAANSSAARPMEGPGGFLVRTYDSLASRLGLATPTPEPHASSHLKSIKSERPVLLRCQGGEAELEADYEMLEFLGRGGFGTVRRARNRTTGLVRAIKAVHCGEAGDGEERWERLFGEVEALMSMPPHPNIVRLHGYYRGKDTLYLVEEFCSGGTLEHRLKQRGGRLRVEEAAEVLRHMLRSVLCCHAHGLSHRDLKLDNYVFASERDTAALKLIDFGLSVSRPPDAQHEEIPRCYVQAGGTLEHSAPETLPKRDGEGRLTKDACYAPPADMWSLGTILFQVLTGEPLVSLDDERTSSAEFYRLARAVAGQERDLLDEAALKVRDQKFIAERLSVARRRAPPQACDLLDKMLQQDPAMRITATQALEHPFVQAGYEQAPPGKGVFDADIIGKMRSFAEAPALRRLAMLIEAHMLGPQDDDGVRTEVLTFRAADQRGCGELRLADIDAALRLQELEVPPDLALIWERIDVHGHGAVNLIEFVAATMEPRVFCEPRLFNAAFRILDADGDGWITQADIENLHKLEGPQRAKTARAILQSAEPDARGRVNFASFCNAMLPRDVDPSLAVKVADYVAASFV